jgi:hypothetical protein
MNLFKFWPAAPRCTSFAVLAATIVNRRFLDRRVAASCSSRWRGGMAGSLVCYGVLARDGEACLLSSLYRADMWGLLTVSGIA